jgi:hypothetical protein
MMHKSWIRLANRNMLEGLDVSISEHVRSLADVLSSIGHYKGNFDAAIEMTKSSSLESLDKC